MQEVREYYGYIYKVTDLLNPHNLPNPYYVGQHKGKFNPSYFGSGNYIQAVVKKYGKENFRLEWLISVCSLEEANKQEIAQIKENDCIWPKGYNLTEGGKAGNYFENHPNKEIIREKARQRQLGKKDSEETIQKKREARIGYITPVETIEKIRKAKSGKPLSEEHVASMIRVRSTPEYKAKQSADQLGRIWVHNLELNMNKKVWPEEVEGYLNNGYKLSRLPISKRLEIVI
jgi:hypothetical protein